MMPKASMASSYLHACMCVCIYDAKSNHGNVVPACVCVCVHETVHVWGVLVLPVCVCLYVFMYVFCIPKASMAACVCVCVCVRERERERLRMCLCICVPNSSTHHVDPEKRNIYMQATKLYLAHMQLVICTFTHARAYKWICVFTCECACKRAIYLTIEIRTWILHHTL